MALLALILVSTARAGAAPAPLLLNGLLSGTGGVGLACPSGGLGAFQDGTVSLAPGENGTFHLEICLPPPPVEGDVPIVQGTFLITTPSGALTGRVSGTVASGSTPGGFATHLVLDIEAGTGGFSAIAGSVIVDGFFSVAALTLHGIVSGSIARVMTPASKEDCKHGGHQSVTDETGAPFENQGQCIAWVHHHRR
jgi:hypothetical protein